MGASNANLITMGATKVRQVSFKVDDELNDRIEAAAETEDLALADFVRKLFVWSLEQYESAGSLRTLRVLHLSEDAIEATLEEERQAFRARRERLRRKKAR